MQSKGVFEIENILKKQHVKYDKEVIINELTINELPGRFDFGIHGVGFIEFDGYQHYFGLGYTKEARRIFLINQHKADCKKK